MQRSWLRERISPEDALRLTEQLRFRGGIVAEVTVPPRCRDPNDHPLPTAVTDGQSDAVVTGDADLEDFEPLLPLCG